MKRASIAGSSNWKREPMVWMLIAIPLSAVIMGIVMLTLAIQSYSGLVVDDYYQQGKRINRVLARDQFASEMQLKAEMRLDANGQVVIHFNPTSNLLEGGTITLNLVHATRPNLDRQLTVIQTDDSPMRANLNLPGPGRWNVFLSTEAWRLTGSLQYPQQMTVALLPNYASD